MSDCGFYSVIAKLTPHSAQFHNNIMK